MAIAIDFGTSNTVISRWNAATQQAETVTLPGLSLVGGMNPPLIPSLVYVEDWSADLVLLGQMVRDRGLDLQADHRYFRSVGYPSLSLAASEGYLNFSSIKNRRLSHTQA
jgi:molecular chaperone DnaK (HSP70)